MVRVLINDGMEESGLELFREAGIDYDLSKKDPETLVREVSKYDGLLVRSATKVSEDVLRAGAGGKLKVVGRAGVGVDNIDLDAATKYGVIVKSAPNGNTNSTAEHAFALMMAVSRHIPQAHNELKWGRWVKKPFQGHEISYKTLGIIGCGRIGQRLCDLVRGFDMDVIGYDVRKTPESRVVYMDKDEVIQRADYLSVHTGGKDVVMGEREIGMMKPSAILINASRGGNVDSGALFMALFEKRIRGAGLDVYLDEPKKDGDYFGSNFRSLDNVVLTPHLAASSEEAQIKTSREMAEVTRDYLLHGSFVGAVNAGENLELETKKVYPLFVFHHDVPGVFAGIDRLLGTNGINIRQVQSRQMGDGMAQAVYLIHKKPSKKVVDQVSRLKYVESVKA